MSEYKMLFSPMNIGKVEIKNRVVMTAMGVDVSAPDGSVTDATVAYYTERAKGGVGLIVTEYCRVNEADGACATGQISLSHDRYIDGMRRLTDSVHAEGAKIFIQVHHPGRQSTGVFPTFWPMFEKIQKVYPGIYNRFFDMVKDVNTDTATMDKAEAKKSQKSLKPVLAPSVLPEDEDDGALSANKTRAFTTREVKKLIQQFVDASERAMKAGADGVELHAAHGYLLEQFLSPWTNRRTDEYGGSRENRRRIIKEIIEGIKARCGKDFPVMVRLTVDEFYEKVGHPDRGIHLEEGLEIAKALENYGADALNISLAGQDTTFLVTESLRYEPGWRNYFTHAVKDTVSIPVVGVSVTRTPEQAEQQLQNGDQDFIGLGRPLLADPQWALKAKEGRSSDITRCIGCLYCMDTFATTLLKDQPIECALNPRTCYESIYPAVPPKDGEGRKVMIAGAGVSGLEAAKVLAERGFEVTVYEKEAVAGGQVNLADKPPFKSRLGWCVTDLTHQAEKAGAKIVYNTALTADMVREEDPYAVLAATGSSEIIPRIKGVDQDFVSIVAPVLNGEIELRNKKVAVIGSGMTGLETAELLMEQGNTVTVVEMADVINPAAVGINSMEIMKALDEGGVRFLPGRKLEEIGDHSIILRDTHTLSMSEHKVDAVVLSLGLKGNHELKEALKDRMLVLEIGNCNGPGRIAEAVRSGYETAISL